MSKDFNTVGPLSSYAGIAPTTRRSGASIREEFAHRGGTNGLKSSLYHSAFAALQHPPGRSRLLDLLLSVTVAGAARRPGPISRHLDQDDDGNQHRRPNRSSGRR